jgi:hypothetical protein
MYCGLSDKDRCKRVFSITETSDECEVSNNKNQKRCKRKSMKKNPKENPKKNTKKKCPKGKILNSETNRCIIDRKKNIKSKKKICPPGKILNSETNRCIIDRRLPENEVIDFKYRCKPGYVYNHLSQRCVKKDGPTGKKIAITSVTNTIGGPISMHYYKFKVNNVMKHFLLFGDRHTQYVHHTSPEIIEITTLVKKIIRKSPHCIDIFSENPPYHDFPKGKKIQKYNSPLNAMRSEFYGCPIHHMMGVKCNYDNLRYQNWDLRFKAEAGKKWKTNPYDELFMKYHKEYESINNRFSKKNIILYILGFTKKIPKSMVEKLDKYFDERINHYQNRKTFVDGISDKDFFQSTRKLIQKEYKKCIKTVEFPKDLLETFINNFISLKDSDYTLVFTDFYTICRMFMKYDKDKKTPKKCKEKGKQNTSQYIIYYAGDSHTENICKFVEKMFNTKPVYTTRSNRYPYGHVNKLIHIKDLRDHKNKKLKDIESVDDLFKDFYE